jgi:hypothetical protein
VTLPMPPHARDAIAALFYVRTLPLRTGEHIRFPVNEAGRNLVVELAVEGIERVHAEGHDVDAIRLSPRIERRIRTASRSCRHSGSATMLAASRCYSTSTRASVTCGSSSCVIDRAACRSENAKASYTECILPNK